MDEKTYMRCKCCGSFIEKEKPKQHPLDELIKEIIQNRGLSSTKYLQEKLGKLRYESIKWAWKDYWKDADKVLKHEDKEHWIVEDKWT